MDKINVVIRKCLECDDYTQLEIEGEIVLCGDYYHDKINDKISGFIEGLRYCEKEIFIEKEEYICEYCE